MAIDLLDDLVSMGIAAPVTKETAGRKYHKELARQVRAQLLATHPLSGHGMARRSSDCLQTICVTDNSVNT